MKNQTKPFCRRSLLKGFGAGAVSAAFGANVHRSLAQGTPALSNASAFYRFNLGALEITVIQDNIITVEPSNFAVDAPEDEVEALLNDHNYPSGVQNVTIDVMLVKSGESLALIDTGLGTGASAPPRLIPTLELIGIQPEAITDVILSHFHPDHLGAVSNDGEMNFPNAAVHIAAIEYDLVQNPPDNNALTDIINIARTQLQPVIDADHLNVYADGDEILPGIQAVATPGHTPGHHAVLLSSGGQQLINMVDTAIHPLISLQNPNWHFVSDVLPDVAVETRWNTLQRAVDEKLFVFGYHFPFPGIGVVDTDGEGFRFIPVGI